MFFFCICLYQVEFNMCLGFLTESLSQKLIRQWPPPAFPKQMRIWHKAVTPTRLQMLPIMFLRSAPAIMLFSFGELFLIMGSDSWGCLAAIPKTHINSADHWLLQVTFHVPCLFVCLKSKPTKLCVSRPLQSFILLAEWSPSGFCAVRRCLKRWMMLTWWGILKTSWEKPVNHNPCSAPTAILVFGNPSPPVKVHP